MWTYYIKDKSTTKLLKLESSFKFESKIVAEKLSLVKIEYVI